MTMHVRDDGTWKEVTGLHVKDDGTWKAVEAGYVRDDGTWKQFYGSGAGGGGSLTITPASAPATVHGVGVGWSGGFTPSGRGETQAADVDYTVTGSVGSLTYSWSRISGPSSSGAFFIASANLAQPVWTAYYGYYDTPSEVWRLTVTDSAGNTGYLDWSIEFTWL